MLPFPIFLFLLISATLLAPPPPVLVGSFKIFTLRSFEWGSLYTVIPDPVPQSPLEDTASFPLRMPLVSLDPSPTQCYPNSTLVANNTIPHSFVRATDDRTGFTAVLLVVSLAMLNCFVYRLLVDESDESHDAERKSEQFTQSQFSSPAVPPQESTHHCTPVVEEVPHPFPSVDTAKLVSESLEHGSLPYSTKSPSTPSFATTILLPHPAPLRQSLLFPVISHGFSLDGSEKTTDQDFSPSTLPASGSALIEFPPVSATQTAAFEASSALFVEPAVQIDDTEVGLPECPPLGTEAAKATSQLLDTSNISYPRNPEPSGELQDDSMSSPAIEDTCELDVDEEDVFCYQPSNLEGDGDETLDYKEVDCTPEVPKTPPAPGTGDRALPSPQLPLRSRSLSLDSAPSFSAKKSASEVVDTRLPSPRLSFLLDRTSVGQSEGGITSITRCASADNLVSTFETYDTAHAAIMTSRPCSTFRCDIFDDTVHNQVTTLSSLRADAPIFKPRNPEMNGVVLLESASVGLEASIHAPLKEEILQTRGRVEVLDPTTSIPERPIESGSFQTYTKAVEEPESPGDTQPTKAAPPRVTDGLRASIHAPPDPSTGTLQALGNNKENLEKEPTHCMTRSNSTRSGLYASIHAPAAGQSGRPAQRSPEHHADVPNWAAICRAEKSSTEDSLPAKCGGDSPDSDLAAAALDEGASEPSTSTRCAASDQDGSSVDDSDGSSLVHADDQEDTTTIDSGEADSTPGEVDASDEQDSAGTGTKPPRKPRRRGGRRARQKILYVPPPRMQNMPVTTQHPHVIDVRAQQGPGQTPNFLGAPASLSRHHYAHVPPAPPHHPTPPPGLMIPPNGIMHDQFGRYPHYYPSSPHVAPIPGFQPPGHHNAMFYPTGPHPHVSPHAPSTLLYGR